jgi:hypothetical protein
VRDIAAFRSRSLVRVGTGLDAGDRDPVGVRAGDGDPGVDISLKGLVRGPAFRGRGGSVRSVDGVCVCVCSSRFEGGNEVFGY